MLKLLSALSFVLASLTFLHLSAIHWTLYFYIPWLDILAHALGGICVALGAISYFHYQKKPLAFVTIVGIVLMVGIGWEFFEYGIGAVRDEKDYGIDTMMDILMDLIGGVLGIVLSRRLI